MVKLNDREHTELLMLYKNAADDIDRAKREQWSHFYAVLLAQAGVAGLAQGEILPLWHLRPDEVFFTALTVLLVLGLVVVFLHQIRLCRLRRQVKGYEKCLEQHTQDLLKKEEAKSVHRIVIPLLMFLALLLVFIFLVIVSLPEADGPLSQAMGHYDRRLGMSDATIERFERMVNSY
jgi:hypothetical protein